MHRRLSVVIVAGSILLSVVLSGWRLAHIIPEGSLDAAATAVRAQFRPGDRIVVQPPYMAGPRLRLGDLALEEPHRLDPDDLAAVVRVHLLELDAIGLRDDIHTTLAGLGTAGATAEWPGVHLTTYILPHPARVLFDAYTDVKRLRVVARYPDGVEQPCDRFDRDRHVCPRNSDWSYVGRKILDIGNEPRACVWMHPLHRGGRLRVSFPDTARATMDGAFVLGGYGFTEHAAHAAQAPVRLRVTIGAREAFAVTHPVRAGWERLRVPVAAGDGPIAVEVESDNNGVAHFCVALRLLEPAS